MRLLVWHWGRNGAGPLYAAALRDALRVVGGVQPFLSLPDNAELLTAPRPPSVDLPVRTYRGKIGFILKLLTAPVAALPLARRLAAMKPDVALCAMPAMLDLLMATALQRCGVPFAVVVHDAQAHLGERVPLQHRLQRALLRRASWLVTLTEDVAQKLATTDIAAGKPVIRSSLPPLIYPDVTPAWRHGGHTRVLFFGRLLPYKGLDLLADVWAQAPADMELRVVGQGPESPELDRLRALPNVTVENRWTPETEMPALLSWHDVMILPYREASQSGVAAAALAAGRRVIATNVGGLADQLQHEPAASLWPPEVDALAQGLQNLQRTAPERTEDAGTRWRRMAEDLARALAIRPEENDRSH